MSNKHDEPAFPVAISVGPNDQGELYKGMSLRDWFAGLAMQALLHYNMDKEHITKAAYIIADKMLKARDEVKL